MKLYYVVGSPNCRKVHAVARHLGIDLDLEYLDFFRGDLRQPAYLARNPNGMVPTLVDGDLVLWESNAIIQYLAEGAGETALYPRAPKVRADVARWLAWELAHYNKAFGILAFETVAKPNFMHQAPDAALVAWTQGELQRHAPVLEAALANRRTLVGDGLTIADYAVGHLADYRDLVPFDWSPYPAVVAYYDRMLANPHWVATAPPSPRAVGRIPA